jgi:hypothetical protein
MRTIIIATPFLVASSLLLYKRLFLGEEQRHLPRVPVVGRAETAAKAQANEVKQDGVGWDEMPKDLAARVRAAEAEAKR